MINQFRYMFSSDIIDMYKEQKLERTLKKIIKSENAKENNKNL